MTKGRTVGVTLTYPTYHITLDFQVLVYQAPPQSARFLGTFHNVLTCAYKTGPQW